jgi:hypothetical protein
MYKFGIAVNLAAPDSARGAIGAIICGGNPSDVRH